MHLKLSYSVCQCFQMLHHCDNYCTSLAEKKLQASTGVYVGNTCLPGIPKPVWVYASQGKTSMLLSIEVNLTYAGSEVTHVFIIKWKLWCTHLLQFTQMSNFISIALPKSACNPLYIVVLCFMHYIRISLRHTVLLNTVTGLVKLKLN